MAAVGSRDGASSRRANSALRRDAPGRARTLPRWTLLRAPAFVSSRPVHPTHADPPGEREIDDESERRAAVLLDSPLPVANRPGGRTSNLAPALSRAEFLSSNDSNFE